MMEQMPRVDLPSSAASVRGAGGPPAGAGGPGRAEGAPLSARRAGEQFSAVLAARGRGPPGAVSRSAGEEAVAMPPDGAWLPVWQRSEGPIRAPPPLRPIAAAESPARSPVERLPAGFGPDGAAGRLRLR